MIRRKRLIMAVSVLMTAVLFTLTACSDAESGTVPDEPVTAAVDTISENITEADPDSSAGNTAEPDSSAAAVTPEPIIKEEPLVLAKGYKKIMDANPIQTQRFGADPYAIEYDGRLYIYMTADAFEKDASGTILDNSYSKIRSINVVSTDDMMNFTDHGEIRVAGSNGAAKWAHNSWAPAACWKMIDGKPKFFLYFADNGGGIGVLTSDSPTGPFTDPLGHALIDRSVPNCANVLWLFDPAVLVDDDGTGYLYFGGGVPEGQAAAPGTGRCVQLSDDMISLACDPVVMDTPYLFEDSGIHKFGNKYYYTYCTNFSVDSEGTKKYGFGSGEIACMVSDSPLGPFTYQQMVLKNPGSAFGLGGNNHHCVFKFNGQWYIIYHARSLEKAMGIEKGYRSTHIEPITIDETGKIGFILMSYDARSQIKNVDPTKPVSGVNVSIMAGDYAMPLDEVSKQYGGGNMYLAGFDTGDYTVIRGVDFGDGASSFNISLSNAKGVAGKISMKVDQLFKDDVAVIDVPAISTGDYTDFTELSGSFTEKITGVHNVVIVCESGDGYGLREWIVK